MIKLPNSDARYFMIHTYTIKLTGLGNESFQLYKEG